MSLTRVAVCCVYALLAGATLACTDDGGGSDEAADGTGSDGSCPDGAQGCACYGNATCNAGLVCSDDNLCVSADCVDGDEGCPCYGNGTCNGELVCGPGNLCESPGDTTTTTGDGDTTSTTGDGDTTTTTGDGDTTTTTGDGDATSTTGDGDTTDTGGTTGEDPGCGDVPADMACVPAATFEMGTDLDMFNGVEVNPWEQPAHEVTLTQSFWIDLTEVTVADYAMCWAAQVCSLPMAGEDLNWGIAGKEDHPANGVDWYQAKAYCEWKGKRLPTEAEWELAARGVDGRMYPWGDEAPTCDHVIAKDCGAPAGTGPVGTKPLGDSPYGVHDMMGNVAEWCADYYQADYYYQSPSVDPQGPDVGTDRAARSLGSFVYSPSPWFRATGRAGWSPLALNVNPAVLGFRCAQTPG